MSDNKDTLRMLMLEPHDQEMNLASGGSSCTPPPVPPSTPTPEPRPCDQSRPTSFAGNQQPGNVGMPTAISLPREGGRIQLAFSANKVELDVRNAGPNISFTSQSGMILRGGLPLLSKPN